MTALTGMDTELGRYLAHSLWQGPVLLLAYLGSKFVLEIILQRG